MAGRDTIITGIEYISMIQNAILDSSPSDISKATGLNLDDARDLWYKLGELATALSKLDFKKIEQIASASTGEVKVKTFIQDASATYISWAIFESNLHSSLSFLNLIKSDHNPSNVRDVAIMMTEMENILYRLEHMKKTGD